MSASFDEAIPVTLGWEGGYSNTPGDKGGPTNFGITQDEVSRFLGHHASEAEVQALTLDQAKGIYEIRYWNVCRCGDLDDQTLATKVFDTAVNCGVTFASKMLQQAVNACGGSLVEDGHIGPLTTTAANGLPAPDLVAECCTIQTDHYFGIVRRDPTQQKFLKGWLRRAAWPKEA